ncbi:hypothetical protein [Candidatus Mycobacterium methanotrophicum]|uniref:Uncharacterized protein n=1 Tax=Candidatus Mycobacterium methanotrophicum TaxID=2943498 RepID=A0ABY4QJ18_9MYCO|nr:hypothetical protein [Candidatus Mycobacterium methanotrophicum]UQX10343.1 hypothetical protein M5I08_19785 [Candidatus Mycobacterium methanotrophicum]
MWESILPEELQRLTCGATGAWYVMERDGFRHPNQFGYAPDGYTLKVIIASRAGYGPTVAATASTTAGT